MTSPAVRGQLSQGWLLLRPHLRYQSVRDEEYSEPQLVGPEEIPAEQSVGEGQESEQSLDDLGEFEVKPRWGPAGSSLEDGETGDPQGCQSGDSLDC